MRAGTETQIVRLAAHLRSQGDEVGILSIMPTAAFADELRALDVPVAHVRLHPRMRAATSMLGGWRVLRAWQPDALISFSHQANVLGRVAGALAGVPVRISSMRNERFGGRSRELLHRVTGPLATATTTNSERAADSFVRRRIVPPEHLVVIPNSLEVAAAEAAAASRPPSRRELGVGDDEFLWVAVGRLHPQKDHATLLAAFARLVARRPTARLRIAGDGALLGELEALAGRLGVDGTARLIGLRDDVPRVLAAADALVLASAWEGLPNAVMEAMAAALPVVATRVGGVPELVDDGRTGLLVPPGDPDALRAAMARVMDLPAEERAKMGGRGRAEVVGRFAPARVGPQWDALLDRCLENAPRRRRRERARERRPPMLPQ